MNAAAAPVTQQPAGGTHGRRVALTLATTFALQGISFVSGALIARMLGVDKRGILAAVVLWPSVIAYLGALGGPTAYAYLASTRTELVPRLIRNAYVITAVQTVALLLLGGPIIWFALAHQPETRNLALIYLLVFIPLNLVSRYFNAINQGTGRFLQFNAVRLAIQGSYVAGIVLLFAMDLDDVSWVVTMLAGSAGIAVLVSVRSVFQKSTAHGSTDVPLIRETFHYGIRSHFGNLTPVDAMQLDLMLVIILLGSRDAGLYAVAVSISLVIRMQGTAIGMVAFPAVASAGSREQGQVVAGRMFRFAFAMNLATSLLILGVASFVVPLVYGDAFASAVPIVRILALGIVAASLRQVLGDCLRGAGRPLDATAAEVVSWVTAVAALAVLVPWLGVEGAALSVGLSYVTALGVSVWMAARSGISTATLFKPQWSDFRIGLSAVYSAFSASSQQIRQLIHRQA